jgi:hypothetical protein
VTTASTPPPASAAPAAPAPFRLPSEAAVVQQPAQPAWMEQQAQALVGIQKLLEQQRAPAPAPAPAPQDTLDELMRDFRAPSPERGESQDAYNARVQQASLQHYTRKVHETAIARAETHATQTVQKILQQAQQQAQQRAAEEAGYRRFYTAVDTAVVGAGVVDPQAKLAMRQMITQEMQALAPRIRTQADFDAAVQHATQKWSPVFARAAAPAPIPGQAPNLVVHKGGQAAPPIMGGGGTGPSTKPAESAPGKASSFDDVINGTWEHVQKRKRGQ